LLFKSFEKGRYVCFVQVDVGHHAAHVLAGCVVGLGAGHAELVFVLAACGRSHVVGRLGGAGPVGF
jgi:hypothetical protein